MTIFLLLGCVFSLSVGQVLFKKSANILKTLESPWHLLCEIPFLGALVAYGFATILWVFALQNVPLSRAYMVMALAFIIVPVFGHYFFGEPLTLRFGLGVLLILAGVLCTLRS